MKISQLALKTNTPASTIRYYEKTGLISVKRLTNGYRHYPEQAIELILLIKRAKSLGFSLSEIKIIAKILATKKPNGRMRKKLDDKKKEIDQKIKELIEFKKNIDELIDSDCPL